MLTLFYCSCTTTRYTEAGFMNVHNLRLEVSVYDVYNQFQTTFAQGGRVVKSFSRRTVNSKEKKLLYQLRPRIRPEYIGQVCHWPVYRDDRYIQFPGALPPRLAATMHSPLAGCSGASRTIPGGK
jgi:hypothetical protein